MSTTSRTWYALDVWLEAAAEEAVQYALMEAGASGTESALTEELMRTSAYFDTPPDRERVREALFEALSIYSLPTSSVREIEFREVINRDWLGEWKRNWQPVSIGRRFIIAPPWSEVAEAPDRIVIRIEPGMAFGTGTHETTRLCLAAIEKYFDGGSFLDVGTGTGILAIAAARLKPEARVEACDTDPEAIRIAMENAQLNHVGERITFRTGTIDETATASANLVCANLTADSIAPLLPQLLAATCGHLILSGILSEQLGMIEEGLSDEGIGEFEVETDGEWVAVIV